MKPVAIAAVLLIVLFASFSVTNPANATGKPPARELYEIKLYHFTTAEQEKRLDDYLRLALLPALHKMGIATAGVFKPIANDTAADKRIYVFMPVKSFDFFTSIPSLLEKDAAFNSAAADYLTAPYNNAPYTRMESILLKAFRLAPQMQASGLTNPKEERVYELRSYESPTEKLYANKVTMFNEGGEVPLFKRLGFNALFYAEVLVGSHMPNLMYMTSFENLAARDAHWKVFSADPEWKKLSGLPEYQHNVSKAEIILLHATSYSDL